LGPWFTCTRHGTHNTGAHPRRSPPHSLPAPSHHIHAHIQRRPHPAPSCHAPPRHPHPRLLSLLSTMHAALPLTRPGSPCARPAAGWPWRRPQSAAARPPWRASAPRPSARCHTVHRPRPPAASPALSATHKVEAKKKETSQDRRGQDRRGQGRIRGVGAGQGREGAVEVRRSSRRRLPSPRAAAPAAASSSSSSSSASVTSSMT
jgi:hypothetical protein